jgi:lysosomal Pro-X carboxypeptidase
VLTKVQQSPESDFVIGACDGCADGGMIAAWFRVHYPNAIDGVIAASAPIWSFTDLSPPYDYNAFDAGVTFDAS